MVAKRKESILGGIKYKKSRRGMNHRRGAPRVKKKFHRWCGWNPAERKQQTERGSFTKKTFHCGPVEKGTMER